jgi:hypothetical protein
LKERLSRAGGTAVHDHHDFPIKQAKDADETALSAKEPVKVLIKP